MKSDSTNRNRTAAHRRPTASAGARWNIHSDVIERIQRHVDTNAQNHRTTGKAADIAQLWQKMAMDRIAVMLSELTSNTSAVIQQFSRNPKSFDMDTFIEYLDRSTEQAAHLADQIANFAEFGKSNGRNEGPTENAFGRLKRPERDQS
jgi:hypothetical protein